MIGQIEPSAKIINISPLAHLASYISMISEEIIHVTKTRSINLFLSISDLPCKCACHFSTNNCNDIAGTGNNWRELEWPDRSNPELDGLVQSASREVRIGNSSVTGTILQGFRYRALVLLLRAYCYWDIAKVVFYFPPKEILIRKLIG